VPKIELKIYQRAKSRTWVNWTQLLPKFSPGDSETTRHWPKYQTIRRENDVAWYQSVFLKADALFVCPAFDTTEIHQSCEVSVSVSCHLPTLCWLELASCVDNKNRIRDQGTMRWKPPSQWFEPVRQTWYTGGSPTISTCRSSGWISWFHHLHRSDSPPNSGWNHTHFVQFALGSQTTLVEVEVRCLCAHHTAQNYNILSVLPHKHNLMSRDVHDI